MSGDICGAVMIIGREISSVKERHFFLKEDYFMFLSPLRDKIKRLAKLKPVPQYTKQSFTFLLDTREMTELWFMYAGGRHESPKLRVHQS